MDDKETRRRKWQMKRLNDVGGERRFRTKEQAPKPIKEQVKRPKKKELLKYAYDPDLPSDVDPWR